MVAKSYIQNVASKFQKKNNQTANSSIQNPIQDTYTILKAVLKMSWFRKVNAQCKLCLMDVEDSIPTNRKRWQSYGALLHR